MREYKFRAWNETAKQMILPSDIYGDIRDELIISLSGEVFLCKEESNGNYCPPTLELKADRNIILMQYTGLKDKNNIDWYEGDLVRVNENYPIHETYFDTDKLQWRIKLDNDASFELNNKIFQIIGNIYENPELLNTKQ